MNNSPLKTLAIFMMVLVPVSLAAANDNPLQQTLNDHYKSRSYTLRMPSYDNVQQFDEAGTPSSMASRSDAWTIDSRVQIKKVEINTGKLQIQCDRIGWRYKHDKLVTEKLFGQVKLEIILSNPLVSQEQFHEILGRIFIFDKEAFIGSMPPLWRAYVEKHLQTYSDDGNTMEFMAIKEPPSKPAADAPETEGDGIYFVGKNTKAPVSKYAPEPSYTIIAKDRHLSGTALLTMVINEQGKPTDIRVQRPLGLGLEEASQAAINTWTFAPGTRFGEPVKVKVSVEMQFLLD